jgi:hypothetical protein
MLVHGGTSSVLAIRRSPRKVFLRRMPNPESLQRVPRSSALHLLQPNWVRPLRYDAIVSLVVFCFNTEKIWNLSIQDGHKLVFLSMMMSPEIINGYLDKPR